MKTKKLFILLSVAGLTLAGAYAIYQLGMQRGRQQHSATVTPASAEKKVLYWHDPMSPGTKFDKPGKSPFMDMQLVPVFANNEADAGGDTSNVTISPRMQQNLGMRLAAVTRGTLGESMQAVGNVAYNEADVTLVQARANGFVEKLYVRTPLQTLQKGQKLAELYIPDWVAAQEEFFTAKKFSANIPGIVEAAQQRMRLAGMSEQQIALVAESGKLQARFTITAPVGGVVTELTAREGMTVMAGAALFRINGLDTVWVNAEIAENNASQIRPGTEVEARSPALAGKIFHGKVDALLPEVNQNTRTVKARIVLANPAANSIRQLLPGMFANISLMPGNAKQVLLIPSEAVIQTGTRSVVMLLDSPGKFRPIEVTTGASAHGQTEILQGLEAGQQVVSSGQFLLDSEASLKGSTARMNDPAKSEKITLTLHSAYGKIEEISPDEWMISHGPVASLKWGAMSMGFKPPAAGLPQGLKVGTEISFDFSVEKDGKYRISRITPLAKSAGAKP